MKNKLWSGLILVLSTIIIGQSIYYSTKPLYLKSKRTESEVLGYNPEKEKLLLTFLDNPTVIKNQNYLIERYLELKKDSFKLILAYYSTIEFKRREEIVYHIHSQSGELQVIGSNCWSEKHKVRKEIEDSICKSIVRKYFN